MSATLLVELFTEELPPKALDALGAAFGGVLASELHSAEFLDGDPAVRLYATPRRLAVTISNVRSVAPDAEMIDKLMPRKVAEDAEGKPTEALRRRLARKGGSRSPMAIPRYGQALTTSTSVLMARLSTYIYAD